MDTITARPGDTWESIAARELGNKTLGDEVAGFNGTAGHTAVPEGAEIKLPYRTPEETPAAKRAKLQAEIDALPPEKPKKSAPKE